MINIPLQEEVANTFSKIGSKDEAPWLMLVWGRVAVRAGAMVPLIRC